MYRSDEFQKPSKYSQNPLAKVARYLRREYPIKTLWGTVTLAGLSACALTIAINPVSTAGLILGSLSLMAAVPVTALGIYSMLYPEPLRADSNEAILNDLKLVGDIKDVSSVVMTQQLINELTRNTAHLPALPVKLERKILAHIKDVEPALSRLSIYKDCYSYSRIRPQFNKFSFRRRIVDENAEWKWQMVAERAAKASNSPKF